MNTIEQFETNRYVHLSKFLDKGNCYELTKILQEEAKNNSLFVG